MALGLMPETALSGVRGCMPTRGSILPYSLGTRYRVGSRQNRMPEKSRSLQKAKPSVAKTLSGKPSTASKSSTANWTLAMSTTVPISSWAAVPVMAATPTMTRLEGSLTIRPAMYTPMVTVMNFSSSPRPPNWPSMISLNTSSPVAAPRAADRGSKSIARVRGMNRKYSTENSTSPTWNLGISSVNSVASPYRDMVSTKIISF